MSRDPLATTAKRNATPAVMLHGQQRVSSCRSRLRSRGGFTLAEVLAALTFLAIVIPVAVEGLRVANRAGQVGQRKAVATRIAQRVLNESLILGGSVGGSGRGVIEEGSQTYSWSIRSDSWSEGTMRLATAEVTYTVQGQEFDVRISTLTD